MSRLYDIKNLDANTGPFNWVTYNTITGNEVSKQTSQDIAQQIADELNCNAEMLKPYEDKLASRKLYVVSGCTRGEFDSLVDEPKMYVEDGMAPVASPQLMGVYSTSELALTAGTKEIDRQMREEDYESDPETGEPYLPGTCPVDTWRWVDGKGKPYDPSCPLVQSTRGLEGFLKKGQPGYDEPWGRPRYIVYLEEPEQKGIRTNPYEDGRAEACVVVQEVTLDEL
jgi:hypothetical protein